MAEPARRQPKEQRLNLRATQHQMELIRIAAEAQGRSLSDFVLATATERAKEILVEQRHFLFSPEAWGKFMEVIENPPPPPATLVELFRDPDL